MGGFKEALIRVKSKELLYFPTNESETTNRKKENNNNGSRQLEVYLDLVKFLIKDSYTKIDLEDNHYDVTKDALAFFVEATRQLYPFDWENRLKDVMDQIQKIRDTNKSPEKSHAETTWLLNDLISNLYQTSLAMNISDNSIEEPKREFLKRSFSRWTSSRELRKLIESTNKEVCIGGINVKYLPIWYIDKFIKE